MFKTPEVPVWLQAPGIPRGDMPQTRQRRRIWRPGAK